MRLPFALYLATAVATPGATASAASKAVPVKVEKSGDAYKLLRGGKPYFIKGAGGRSYLDVLVASGGNSIRTWGEEEITPLLDRWLNSEPDPQASLGRVLAFHPLGRIGTPQDIGNLVVFLASDYSGFISGTNITIDGGLTARLMH